MELIEFVAYFCAMLVGVIMGLLGSGGSLIVPVLVFLFLKDDISATAYASFIVGLTAGFGMVSKIRKKEVSFPTAITFVIPISIGTFLGRSIMHIIPDGPLFEIAGFPLTRRQIVLTIYSLLLILSFTSMMGLWGKNITPRSELKANSPFRYYLSINVIGLVIGFLSAVVGAGGGIMIMPALVILMGLDMKQAVGTSLTIQVIKSFFGFGKDLFEMGDRMEWSLMISVTGMTIIGILLGSYISNFVSGQKLKTGYGWMVLAMAILILVKELVL